MKEITFRFDSEELAARFLGWLSACSEQDFMQVMEDRDGVNVDFDYWSANPNTFGPVVVVSSEPMEDGTAGPDGPQWDTPPSDEEDEDETP